jgi:glycosyltransferase involved in cell wall biosynthesis
VYHGLLGQRELAKRLTECTFALYLQTRAEPFGIAIAEALAAGCVTIASPVGAHPEIIEQGVTGFLVEGDPTAHTTRDRATELIVSSVGDRRGASAMSKRAQSSPLDWDTVAATWEQYWQGGDAAPVVPQPVCRQCSGRYIALADGWHCTNCGYYSKPYIG